MQTLTLNLETVTPLFLSGANNREVELRPPPFKALMRYWWRAVQSQSDEQRLSEKEGKLFGSTQCRSRLRIRIPGTRNLRETRYKPLPHRTDRRGFQKAAFRPGETFQLVLSIASGHDLDQYEPVLRLGLLLGGIGNRSRRGFGSIRDRTWTVQDIGGLQQLILETLDVLTPGRFVSHGGRIEARSPASPGYPVIKNICFGLPSHSMDGLLRKIGQATHDHADNALGSGKPRMASPVIVRVQKLGNAYVPIVTQVHSVFPRRPYGDIGQTQQDFVDAIVR